MKTDPTLITGRLAVKKRTETDQMKHVKISQGLIDAARSLIVGTFPAATVTVRDQDVLNSALEFFVEESSRPQSDKEKAIAEAAVEQCLSAVNAHTREAVTNGVLAGLRTVGLECAVRQEGERVQIAVVRPGSEAADVMDIPKIFVRDPKALPTVDDFIGRAGKIPES